MSSRGTLSSAKPELADDTLIVTNASILRTIIAQEVAKIPTIYAADRLVNIKEAAKILSVSTHWLYHQRNRLPFTRKLGRKQLRFSVNGIQRWIDSGCR